MPPWEPGVVFPLAALRLFGMQPSLVVLAGIQVGLDVAVLFAICWVALEFGGPLGALAAGSIYSESIPLATASTFPFYYYWPIPIIVALAAVLLRLSQSRSARAALAWGTLAGALAAGGCWFRGTMVTVALLTPFIVFVLSRATGRPVRAALFAVAAIILVLLPSAWHNLPRTGSVLPRRQIWHDMYIGIGTRPNPYGIIHDDSSGASIAMAKHGVAYHSEGYERAMRTEYLSIVRANPSLILSNFVRNTWDGLRGVTVGGPLPGRLYSFPWLCMAGLACLFLLRRNVALPAAACALLWLVQCATLGIVGWPQEGYLWETLGMGVLCGAFGLGAIVDSIALLAKPVLRNAVRKRHDHLEKARDGSGNQSRRSSRRR
jgi:hypothetical protein